MNGSAQKAQVDGAGRLRLTSDVGQAGSAFTQQKLISTRKSFAISFRTLLHEGSDPPPPADGLTFTILKGVPTALGEAGSGLGYGGIPGRSLAIEHDIFNACCDPDSNHVGLLHYGSTLGEVVARTVPFPLYGQLTRTWFVYAAKKKLLRVSLLIKQP